MTDLPAPNWSVVPLEHARRLGAGSELADAAIAVATAFADLDTAPREATDAALRLCEAAGDPLLLDAALDMLGAVELADGDLPSVAATLARRRTIMAAVPVDPSSGMDHVDCALMSAYVEMAAGRLDSARSQADALAALPFLREEPHVGWARRIEIDALAGRFDDALAIAESFRAGWVRAGRPRVNNFGPAAHAVAMVHGMRNDDAAREEWIEVTTDVLRSPGTLDEVDAVWPALFDGLLLLHRGDAGGALARMSASPDELARECAWHKRLFLTWYAAAWAEASTLGHADDLIDRLEIASSMAQGNAVALLVIDRARLLADGRRDGGVAGRRAGDGDALRRPRVRVPGRAHTTSRRHR